MDLKTLRIYSGRSVADAAAAAGVTERTWRRWEAQGHPLAERWLSLEAGDLPGWPRGWRLGRDGLWTPDGEWIPSGVIEAARWVLGLARRRDRMRAYAIAGGEPAGASAQVIAFPSRGASGAS